MRENRREASMPQLPGAHLCAFSLRNANLSGMCKDSSRQALFRGPQEAPKAQKHNGLPSPARDLDAEGIRGVEQEWDRLGAVDIGSLSAGLLPRLFEAGSVDEGRACGFWAYRSRSGRGLVLLEEATGSQGSPLPFGHKEREGTIP